MASLLSGLSATSSGVVAPWPASQHSVGPGLLRRQQSDTPPGIRRASSMRPLLRNGTAERAAGRMRERSPHTGDSAEVTRDIRGIPIGPEEQADWIGALDRIEQKYAAMDRMIRHHAQGLSDMQSQNNSNAQKIEGVNELYTAMSDKIHSL